MPEVKARSHWVSVWCASIVEGVLLNWLIFASIPPSGELCTCVTGPVGVVANAVSVLVCENAAVLTPEALPMNPGFWFCLMSSTMFAPPAAAFWRCVMLPEPVAVDVRVCDWSSGPERQVPLLLAFRVALPPEAES